jgi:MFS family permease
MQSTDDATTAAPVDPSPYEGTRLTVWSQLIFSSYWLASNVLWGAVLAQMLPSQVSDITAYNKQHALATGVQGLGAWLHFITTQKGPALGVIGSAVAIVSLIVPLIVGPMSDRCTSHLGRRRPFILYGSLLSMGALMLMYVAGRNMSLWGFMVAYCFVALGNNIATAAYFGVIPDLVPSDQRGIASGYMAMMSQVGTLVGVMAAGFLKGSGTFLGGYAVVIVTIGAFAALTVVGIREKPLATPPPRLDWRAYIRKIAVDPWKHRDFLWVWVTRFLVMLGFYSVEPYIQYYLHDVIGVTHPERVTAMLLGLILVGATVSGMVGGWVSERVGRKKVVYVSNAGIAAMCVALMFCRTIHEALLVGMVFGLAYGAYVSVDWALGTDVLPSKDDVGKDMAVWHIAMTLPQSITPLIAGSLMLPAFGSKSFVVEGETHYSYAVGGYVLVFAMAALFFILGAVFLRNVKKAR